MHIAEGVLSAPVLGAGAVLAGAGVAVGLWKMQSEDVPRVAVLSSVFFVASLIHVPVGVGSAHLILNGLVGLVLGWAAFPAILVALTLQAVLFGYGGLTTLGVNTLVMAGPALACYGLLGRRLAYGGQRRIRIAGGVAGALSILLGGLIAAGALVLSGREFLAAAQLLLALHLPVMAIEALVTAAAVSFLFRVRPEALGIDLPSAAVEERSAA